MLWENSIILILGVQNTAILKSIFTPNMFTLYLGFGVMKP